MEGGINSIIVQTLDVGNYNAKLFYYWNILLAISETTVRWKNLAGILYLANELF